MKNFQFPQIFQPVVGDSNSNLSMKWQMTSRRIQTQIEIANSNPHQKTYKLLKSSQHNFLMKSPNFELIEKQPEKQSQLQGTSHQKNVNQTQVQFDIPDQNIDPKNKPYSPKMPTLRTKKTKKTFIPVQTLNESRRNLKKNDKKPTQANYYVKDFKIINDRQKRQSNDRGKNEALSTNIEKIKQQLKTEKGQQERYYLPEVKIQKTLSNNQQIQKSQLSKLIQSTQITEYNKKDQQKSNFRQKRRFAIDNLKKIEVDFDMTQEKNKILISNKKLMQSSDTDSVYVQLEKDFQKLQNRRSTITSERRNYRNKTFHYLQDYHQPVKVLKKFVTIWNIHSESSFDDDNLNVNKSEKEKNEKKESNKVVEIFQRQKKSKSKKVHFYRTSIEEKAKASENASKKEILSIRKLTSKGIPKRSRQGGEYEPSSGELSETKEKSSRRSLRVFKNRPLVVRKQETENVYNELNYLRMRMYATEKEQRQVEVNRPYPQPIAVSVERVWQQFEHERIERTRMSNMMIDFGVKLTRDYFLKQTGVREKVLRIAI